MSDGLYIDNDVVIKACALGVGAELTELTTLSGVPPAILGLARFTLATRVNRSRALVDKVGAAAQLAIVLARVRSLEPTPSEVDFAAELEAAANAENLAFDTGESQLVAMLISRGGRAFITGDKRAAQAMAIVVPHLEERMICLEQVIHSIITRYGLEPLRSAVCREAASDRAIAICFQCSLQEIGPAEVLCALESYTSDLRKQIGKLLIGTVDMGGAKIP